MLHICTVGMQPAAKKARAFANRSAGQRARWAKFSDQKTTGGASRG